MRKKYGITWWGKQWLNAFNHISDPNRLPRGRTYANTGRARDIEINGNLISARVMGSRPRPYRVTIVIPKFTSYQKTKLLELVQENPLFLSQLLNRELPPSFDEACIELGIQIFPSSWQLLDAQCSCPDWAMPCKHLASVLYLVANEIDKNPFLVLELHDFDLLKLLEESGIGLGKEKNIHIKSIKEFTENVSKKKSKKKWQFDASLVEQLDFSQIPECTESLMRILDESPVFYPQKDFKKILNTKYKKTARNVNKDLKIEKKPEANISYEQIDDIEIIVSGKYKRVETYIYQNGLQIHRLKSLEELVDWIQDIDFSRVSFCIPKLQALYYCLGFSMKLAGQGAIVPQLLKIDTHLFKIRWIPALLNAKVKEVFTVVEKLIPPELIFYKKRELVKQERSIGLVSLFVSEILRLYNGDIFFDNSIEDMFFAGSIEVFNSFEDREYPAAIQLWLNKFYLTEKKYIPIICVSDGEKGNKFKVELKIENTKKKAALPDSLKDVFTKKSYQKDRLAILRDLSSLTGFFPEIAIIISSKGKDQLIFDSVSFTNVLFKILPLIQLLGIKVLLPKELRKLIKPSLSMSLALKEENNKSFLSLGEMLSFQWNIALGEKTVSYPEFLKLVRKYKGIIKINDQYVFFDENEVANLLKKIENPPNLNQHDIMHAALSEDYDGYKVNINNKIRKLIEDLLKLKKVPVPKGLKATLRPYQQRGYDWMYKNSKLGFGSLIADDMGLGKTIQVITTALKMKEEGRLDEHKALIVVPTTLLTNWQKELERFAPSIKNYIYHGPNRKLDTKKIDLIITTYGMVRSDADKLKKEQWGLLVIDESQNIKNPQTHQTKAVKKLKAKVIIAMSGTPVENRLTEYWSVFDFTNKGYLGGLDKFKKGYALPIEIDRDKAKLEKFRKITAPFIMRRLKSDKKIIKDLPDKIESNQYCVLTKDQAALYESTVTLILETINNSEGIERRGLILKLMTALKQICNHPKHFLKNGSNKYDLSGKGLVLYELLKSILENGEKTLIFTQYKEMGNILVEMLKQEFGINAQFLHGGISRKKRDAMVQDFQENHSNKIFLLSLKAGGTGLNLTAASNVVHYDLWWNPAVESQATDRAYRIGQKKNVQVYRFITKNTFEEKIDKMIQSKKELANLTVNTGEKWIGELSNNELRELVELEG